MKVFAAESVNTGAKRMGETSPSTDNRLSLIGTGVVCGILGALIALFVRSHIRNGAVRVHTAGYVVRPQVRARRQGPTCSSADRRDRTGGCAGPAAHTTSIDPASGELPVVPDGQMAQTDDARIHGESCAAARENANHVLSDGNLGDLANANQSLLHCDFTYGTASITGDLASTTAYTRALNRHTEATYEDAHCKLLDQGA